MTRTERSTSPRAIIKDRSESKSGYDKSLRKNGAGPHNWGSLSDELELEREALEDAELEAEELDVVPGANADVEPPVEGPTDETLSKTSAAVGDEEVEKAKEIRKKGLTGDVDLITIARTSAAVSGSPPKGTHTIEVTRGAPTHTLN